jgi:hypothetical protein
MEEHPDRIPLGQRIFGNPFLLLILGILTTVVFYTAWGLLEMMTMTEAPLP